ncbi:MAG: TatD family hydrolase [Patescibacteria group bacterium]
MIDTHCHVHFRAYKDDMDEVIKRSLEKGVRMVTVGTQSTTSKNGIEVAEKYDGVYTTIGLHPNHTCEQHFEDELEEIKTRCESFDVEYYRELGKHPKVVAIGECGLDYYRIPEEVDRAALIVKQKEELRKQLSLADELNLPVVIHCRDAHTDQVAMLKEFIDAGKLSRRGVIHCFTGTIEEARAYHAIGFLTSFTGIITFPPRKSEGKISSLQQVVRDCPLEMMMLETDAPYLTPEPFRGKRNEPWYVQFVAAKVAALKNISVEEVDKVTTTNAEKLFGLK